MANPAYPRILQAPLVLARSSKRVAHPIRRAPHFDWKSSKKASRIGAPRAGAASKKATALEPCEIIQGGIAFGCLKIPNQDQHVFKNFFTSLAKIGDFALNQPYKFTYHRAEPGNIIRRAQAPGGMRENVMPEERIDGR